LSLSIFLMYAVGSLIVAHEHRTFCIRRKKESFLWFFLDEIRNLVLNGFSLLNFKDILDN
jgi:hypothetical protein